MRIDMNERQVWILGVHFLEDRPGDEMLAAKTDREFAVSQQAAHIFPNDFQAAGCVAERQQQIASVEVGHIDDAFIQVRAVFFKPH
ncbi:hypothetical protein D3C85_1674440 [compost metagenome]